MSELECIICCHPFKSGINLPRVLQCGHTICTPCLGNILKSTKTCPSCRNITIKDNVNDYSINYTVLKICESKMELDQQYTKENFIQLFQEKLQKRIENHRELRITLESLKDETDLNIGLIRSNEQQLASLSDDCDPFNKDTRRILKEIDESFNTTCGQLHNLCDTRESHLIIISDISFMSDLFDSFEEFFQMIHDEIVVGNNKLAAVLRIKGVKHYAKLSVRDDFLFIHSFERFLGNDRDVTTVCFQDLQDILLRCGKAESIYAFLDLCYCGKKFSRRIMVEMEDSTAILGSQFLKLVTGELGISYKGREYAQSYGKKKSVSNNPSNEYFTDTIIHVKNVNWSMKEVDNYTAYYLKKKDNKVKCSPNSCYLQFDNNGEFDIFRFHNYPNRLVYNNVIGSVIDSNKDLHCTFKDASVRKVLDCGIALKL